MTDSIIFFVFINASRLAHDFYRDGIRIIHRSKNAVNASNFFESVFHEVSDGKDKMFAVEKVCIWGSKTSNIQ